MKEVIISKILEEVSNLKKCGEKNIQHAIFNTYVKQAFTDFVKEMPEGNWAVIGGLAVSTWEIPRDTQDVDIIIVGIDVPILPSFKRTRSMALVHKKTGVEIELLKPQNINQTDELVQKAIDNSIIQEVENKKVKVVDPKYLIALKLGRAIGNSGKSYYDRGDIVNLTKLYGKQDLSDLKLPQEQLNFYNDLV